MAVNQDWKIREGDLIKLKTTGQILTIKTIKILANGKTTIGFTYKEDSGQLFKSELYLEVMELMGIEKVEK